MIVFSSNSRVWEEFPYSRPLENRKIALFISMSQARFKNTIRNISTSLQKEVNDKNIELELNITDSFKELFYMSLFGFTLRGKIHMVTKVKELD